MQGWRNAQGPGKKADRKHRQEVVPALGAVEVGRRVADEIFFPKKIAQIAGIALLDCEVPGRSDRKKERNAERKAEPAHLRKLAGDDQIKKRDHARQSDADRSLYEGGGRRSDIHYTEQRRSTAARRLVQSAKKSEERQGRKKGQGHVEDDDAREHKKLQARHENQRAPQALPKPEKPAREKENQQNAARGGQSRGQARRPF